ncbi:MAG: FixJ family two-component response regulator [Gammaproteobacteria bacterium]
MHINKICVVEPDSDVSDALKALLETHEFTVQIFPDGKAFIVTDVWQDERLNCLMVEADLPGLSGLSLLKRLRTHGFGFSIIILSNAGSADLRTLALEFGATDLIEKLSVNALLTERLSRLFQDVAVH